MITVYKNKWECCGCGTCVAICSQNAIVMKEDKYGFTYPYINQKKCIDCGACIQNCAYGKINQRNIMESYAGQNTNKKQKKISTSAGIFSAIATQFLEGREAVCGATMKIENGKAEVRHIVISSLDDLFKLQGSKYVQSNFSNCYGDILNELKKGKKLLISGTPCQVASARVLLKKYKEQIYFVDIICHGVPSEKFFNDYLKYMQKREKIDIIDFKFRNKKFGWGLYGSYKTGGEINKSEYQLNPQESSYYRLFLNGETYRESCYRCPYACQTRIGDLTIGDYWGADKYSPEIMIENGGSFSKEEGVSCILVNTEKGKKLLELASDNLELKEIELSKILVRNTQLQKPAKSSIVRKIVLSIYSEWGYAGVEKIFDILKGLSRCKSIIK